MLMYRVITGVTVYVRTFKGNNHEDTLRIGLDGADCPSRASRMVEERLHWEKQGNNGGRVSQRGESKHEALGTADGRTGSGDVSTS